MENSIVVTLYDTDKKIETTIVFNKAFLDDSPELVIEKVKEALNLLQQSTSPFNNRLKGEFIP